RKDVGKISDAQTPHDTRPQNQSCGDGPSGIENFLIGVSCIAEDKLHVEVDGADRSDGADASQQQQPERPTAQQISEAVRSRVNVSGSRRQPIGMLAHFAGFIFQKEYRERPRQKHVSPACNQRSLKAVLRRDGTNEKWRYSTEQADSDVNDSHSAAAFPAKPVGHQNLVWDRPAKQIPNRVDKK